MIVNGVLMIESSKRKVLIQNMQEEKKKYIDDFLNIYKNDLYSFEDVKKEGTEGNYIAFCDDGKEYDASFTNDYGGVMFFCIPSDVNVLGYLKVL